MNLLNVVKSQFCKLNVVLIFILTLDTHLIAGASIKRYVRVAATKIRFGQHQENHDDNGNIAC